MAQIPTTRGSAQASEIAVQSALATLGSQSREDLQTTLGFADSELNKLFGDRNAMLADGGLMSYSGNVLTFSQNLDLILNSNALVPGNPNNPPIVINLGGANQTFTTNGDMWYAVVNRSLGTATTAIASAATGLPTVNAANSEIFLLAKRSDSADSTGMIYLRNGRSISSGLTLRLGNAGSVYASEFSISDKSDTSKKVLFTASGNNPGASSTIQSSATGARVLALPDASTTLVGVDAIQTLSNKTFSNATIHSTISTPSVPPGGSDKLYFKSDNQLYSLSSGGVESQISGALISPLLTKGDLIVRDASGPVRLPVGSNIQVLTADNTTSTGVRWVSGPVPLMATTTISGNYTAATMDDNILCNAGGGGFIISLPTVSGITGKVYRFKKLDGTFNVVTINTTGGQTIDGDGTSTTLNTQWEELSISTDGNNWQILSRTYPSRWSSATFQPAGGLTSMGTQNSFSRRVGDSLECRVSLINLGASNGTAQIGLPSGLLIDTSKVVDKRTNCGVYNRGTSNGFLYGGIGSAVQNSGIISVDISANTSVFLSFQIQNGDSYYGHFTMNSFIVSGDGLIATFTVPIAGWK